jgi:hypothetical protein
MAEADPASISAKPSTQDHQGESQKGCRLPGPRGAPFAWAESRQELCESLPYYRAYHSGCYATSAKFTSAIQKHKSDIVRDCVPFGYLLAGFGSSRDVWKHGGRVIISHGGGKSGKEDILKRSVDDVNPNIDGLDEISASTEAHKAIGDQTLEDGQISALVHSHRCQTPIVLLIAKDYKLSHFELPCAFAVLGWYWITDVWCEREPSKDGSPGWVRWKFRFQYIQSQGRPWWLGNEDAPFWSPTSGQAAKRVASHAQVKKSSTLPTSNQWSSGKVIQRPAHLASITIDEEKTGDVPICSQCRQSSPMVFQNGWMCLSQNCAEFWRVSYVIKAVELLRLSRSCSYLMAQSLKESYYSILTF